MCRHVRQVTERQADSRHTQGESPHRLRYTHNTDNMGGLQGVVWGKEQARCPWASPKLQNHTETDS